MKRGLAVILGAALFAWPALMNGYPIVFSDTGAFIEQGLTFEMGWDKPFVYGPLLAALSAGLSLWPAVAGQCLVLSAMLWLVQLTVGSARPGRHLLLCAMLAACSAAPWFASLLMPDILAPVTVLGLFVLAFGPGRLGRITLAATGLLTAAAIASHLAHLVLAAACIAALVALRWRLLWRPALPLAGALAFLLVSNTAGLGRIAVSPYGSVFALARLVADGPARDQLEATCPNPATPRLCAWQDRLPTDSDAFLWEPRGPVWADDYGPTLLAPEAATVVAGTLHAYPGAVLAAALRNTLRQLTMAAVGDTLVPDHLDVTVRAQLGRFFPPAERTRYDASRQAGGTLAPFAAGLAPLYAGLLGLSAAATALMAATGWRSNRALAALAVLILVALLGNAAATGALSGPHNRYQARIAWLVLLPPALLLVLRPSRPGGGTSWPGPSAGPAAAVRPAAPPAPPPPPRAAARSCGG